MSDNAVILKEAFLAELRAFGRKAKRFVRRIPPPAKAAVGVTGALLAHTLATRPIQEHLLRRIEAEGGVATTDKPVLITKDKRGKDLYKWVKKFKEEHPETKQVPVYVSGRIPTSQYISETAFKFPGSKEALKEDWKITKPGVYIRELAAPVALHELGHVALEKKVPAITLLTHGISALAIPLLAYVVLKKRVRKAGFIEKYSPAIAAGLQVPVLAEEAAASIIAEKTLKAEGETGRKVLGPALATYGIQATALPLMTAAAKYLKRL